MAAALNTVRLIGTSRAFSSRRCAVTVISSSASAAAALAASSAIAPAPWDAAKIAAALHSVRLMRSRRRESRTCVIAISQYLCDSTGRRRGRRRTTIEPIPSTSAAKSFLLLGAGRQRIRKTDKIDQGDLAVFDGGVTHDAFAAVLAVLPGPDEVMREDSIAVRRGKFIEEG